MTHTEFGDSLLILQFREFYREVIRLKEITGVSGAQALATSIEQPDLEGSAADTIWRRLMAALEQQMRVAVQFGGDYLMAYEQARYVMVSLADEIFLHSDWEGRYAWNFNLLETHLYQTQVAGDLLFQRIDRLILTRESSNIELAKIYLMALALGFQGRYRGNDATGELLRYRHRLYDYIFQGVHVLSDTSKPLFPHAGEHLLDAGEPLFLPPIRRWVVRLAVVVIIALGLQQIVWRYFITPEIREHVEQILEPKSH